MLHTRLGPFVAIDCIGILHYVSKEAEVSADITSPMQNVQQGTGNRFSIFCNTLLIDDTMQGCNEFITILFDDKSNQLLASVIMRMLSRE